MASRTQSGQAVVELALISVLLVSFFLLATSIATTSRHPHKHYRFSTNKSNQKIRNESSQ